MYKFLRFLVPELSARSSGLENDKIGFVFILQTKEEAGKESQLVTTMKTEVSFLN